MTALRNFEDFFSEEHLSTYFEDNLITRNGGGRDGMSPKVFWEIYADQINIIAKKCQEGSYKFATYNELLFLRGKDKLPRIISVPTVRDRLVLGVLNEFLQNKFPEAVCHDVPNQYIDRILKFVISNQENNIGFLRIDFKAFYSSINQNKLLNQLKMRISEANALSLIKKAIQTSTCNRFSSSRLLNRQGVPQGLAISNMLSSIYLQAFDAHFIEKIGTNGLYIRYVDDILFLYTKTSISPKVIKEYLTKNKMRLSLAKDKTEFGVLYQDTVDFIGYLFTKRGVSIRAKSKEKMICRLANLCSIFRKEYDNSKRILFAGENQKYVEFFICELNMLISGFKYKSRCYGWLPYYRSITDISLFYELDNILRTKLLRNISDKVSLSKIHTFVQSYYELKNKGGGRLILDFSKLDTPSKQAAYLRKMGVLREDKDYKDEEIHFAFEKYIYRKKRQVEENIGYV